MDELLDASQLTGFAKAQTEEFIEFYVKPLLAILQNEIVREDGHACI